jgi:hypothetical protein
MVLTSYSMIHHYHDRSLLLQAPVLIGMESQQTIVIQVSPRAPVSEYGRPALAEPCVHLTRQCCVRHQLSLPKASYSTGGPRWAFLAPPS